MSQESQHVSAISSGGVIVKPTAFRSRAYVYTINNYDQTDIDLIISAISELSPTDWIYGFEIGTSGTKHIQGYFRFKHQIKFKTIQKKLPKAHIEKAKGNVQQNFKYCSKEGNYKTNIVPKLSRDDIKNMVKRSYEGVVWKDWQSDLIDTVDTCKSSRAIHWVHEPTGNVGKSYLAKFLALRTGTIICQGKSSDIFNQVNACIESGSLPKLVLVDVPRVTLDYVSYNAIECLKNGMLYSGKYEGGICIFPQPTVCCFANEPPKREKLSEDRWRVYRIKDDKLFLQVV